MSLFLHSFGIDVLCITEHWLREHELLNSLENYKIVSAFIRKTAIRGGSMILLKNTLKYKERKDITNFSIERTIEISCVELEQFIIVCVYRPPSSNYITFELAMEDLLKCISKSRGKTIIICGDFNVNLLENCSTSVRFLSLFNSYDLSNLFFEPTRVTSVSSTCIDNIFSNREAVSKSILNTLRSDHSGQLVSYNCRLRNGSASTRCRPITTQRIARFQEGIRDRFDALPYNPETPNDLYKPVLTNIKVEFDNVFKTKSVSGHSKSKFNEWATVGIHRSRIRLYELYAMKSFRTDHTFIDYVKRYSKLFKKVCIAAKVMFYSNKIKNSNNTTKATWSIINKETGKIMTREKEFTLEINGNLVKSKEVVAKTFEQFFSNIAATTTESLRSSASSALGLLMENVVQPSHQFQFTPINAYTIVKTFRSLNIKSTEDLWGMSVTVVNHIIQTIAPHLAVIFNKCINDGLFPDLMKHSKVIPLFKSGQKTDPTNYRPISILPALSKVFEKLMLNQLESYFVRNNLFHDAQYGFTKGRSTSDAGTALLGHVFDAWERSQSAIGVFCDLSKAFDCVDHSTLIKKLEFYGVRDKALDLLSSYLSNRIQKVFIDGITSSGSSVKMGVPQGSILGPFLFLIYINDLPFLIKGLCDVVLFADDTSLIFKTDRHSSCFDEVNSTLSKVVNWFTSNNLLLNAKKTKCIQFELPNVKSPPPNIMLNGEILDLVDDTVFLGIAVDKKLQWFPHISSLAKRLSSAAFAVRRIRELTDCATAKLVYFSYFHSIMSYGILMWGKAADIQTIFVLQKRAVRSIYRLKARTSLREKFKESGIMTLACQYIYSNIIYAYKNIEKYVKKEDLHNINLRNKSKICVPYFRLTKVKDSFMGNSIRFINKVPRHILDLPMPKFKLIIKNVLLKKAYYKINEYLSDTINWNDELLQAPHTQ